MIEHTPEIIGALEAIVKFIDKLGVPGLVLLLFLGPALIVVALFALDFLRQRHAKEEAEARRKETQEQAETHRKEVQEQLAELKRLEERHREDMDKVLYDLYAKHAEVTQYYKDNVELVKTTQRLAIDMRDIITNNTRAVESLRGAVQGNFFCPAAREAATGKK
ncbi:hypothetical protein [Desulfovibrio cuneatus]|uniref:hypothetical protein n=1 Tax=Desulfovibrio cuneatus TaxID=159728 RepID=UPI0003FFA310|nr:hypothetical protein [Desulfovibrio cuneatus]